MQLKKYGNKNHNYNMFYFLINKLPCDGNLSKLIIQLKRYGNKNHNYNYMFYFLINKLSCAGNPSKQNYSCAKHHH